jgi:hypothetical protein
LEDPLSPEAHTQRGLICFGTTGRRGKGLGVFGGDGLKGLTDDYATIKYSSAGVPLWVDRWISSPVLPPSF